MAGPRIVWSDQAKVALKLIYSYHKLQSVRGANNVKRELLQAPRTIHFSKQYQVDDINPEYRRIVVRDYKIIYKEYRSEIRVMDIVSTRQAPEVLRRK